VLSAAVPFRVTRAIRLHGSAWARLSGGEAIAEVIEHGPAIMRHENAALGCGEFKKVMIGEPVQSRLLSGRKVDGPLQSPHCSDDCEPEVVVSLETQAQARDSSGFAGETAARAFWIRSQSEGLAWDIGMPHPSNLRSVSSRYLSISA